MTRRTIQNFRGLRVAILLGVDRNRTVLTESLVKLGLKVQAADPMDGAPALRAALEHADLVFFDADLAEAITLGWAGEPVRTPTVAVIGLEAPGRLLRAFELEPTAVLHKPLRSTGIYSALFFAVNEHRRRQEVSARIQSLETRHHGRRFVTRAIVRLMQSHGIDDDQAYRLLRKESMVRRITIEEFAGQLLAANAASPARKANEL
jgi:two-component system, response regulator / RNA-binding antiterminator